ncbi:uncharacterized protein [Engystomops pustulosus]|uniref:uncharacterized protein isoform X1 n=1 Tax=Engystomops pustulosus TaxID=76066 RepID=UPI003AFB20E9
MFYQGFLLLIVAVGLTSSLPQPLKWAKLKLFPAPTNLPTIAKEIPQVQGETLVKTVQTAKPGITGINPLPSAKDTIPLLNGDPPVNAATVGDKPILPESGILGSTEISGLNPLPIVDATVNIPVSKGDLPLNVATIGDKSILPEAPEGLPTRDVADNVAKGVEINPSKIEVPGSPEIPLLNPLSLNNATDNLTLPKDILSVTVAVGDKSISRELEVPGPIAIPEPNKVPFPTINPIESLPAVNAADNISIPGAADIPELDTQPKIITTDCLPIAKGDETVKAVTGGNPNLTNFGAPGTVAELYSLLKSLSHNVSRMEAVLKLEGRIQVVGDKMMATSGKEVDFVTSKSACKAVGGIIATPRNEAENIAVLAFVKKYKRYAYLGKEGSVPGNFKYLNRVPAVYTRWRKGEPREQAQETCIEMYTDGQWNTKACNQKRLTVCEL